MNEQKRMPANSPPRFPQLAAELLAAWEAGQSTPSLDRFFPASGALLPEELVELCLIDQAFRWRTDGPLRVEDYLARYPQIAQDQELLLELAYGEMRARQQLGAPVRPEELEARFPALATRLREQWEVGMQLDQETVPLPPANPHEPVCVLHPSQAALQPQPPICALHRRGRMGPYELREVVAHGGMGVVFRACHEQLQRLVALKVMRPDRIANEADRRRFHNETVTIAQLDHPHIVPIYDVGEVEGVHYFTMKLMEGGDLQQHCRRYLDHPREAVRVMIDVAEAVHYAHQCGVLHRDVKPSNVLLDQAGKPHVTDFGLARRLDADSELADAEGLLGTPAYMAPEHLSAELGPLTVAADIYGVGAVLYVLLTGKPPFEGRDLLAMLEDIRSREPMSPRQLNPRVDADLEQICRKAMAKQPGDRYPSAQALADDLRRFLAGESVQARPLPWWHCRWRWIRRHPDLALVSAIVLLAAVFLLGLLGVQTMRLHATHRSLDQSLETVRQQEAETEVKRREAARLRNVAEQFQTQAATARAKAIADAALARESVYVAAMRQVETAWRAGDTVEFSRLLDQQLPAADEADVRGCEWFLLDRLYRPRPLRVPQRTAAIRCVGYAPDGRFLAAAGDPGQLQVVDTASGREVASWPCLSTVRDLAFSPDSHHVATVGDDGHLRLYPAEGGMPQSWPVSDLPVWHVAFVTGGPLVATCDQQGTVRLIDGRNGQGAATWSNEPGEVHSLTVAPHGRWLVVGQRDGWVILWDVARRDVVYRFRQATPGSIKCLAVSPDGTRLATGCTDNLLCVYRLSEPWAHETLLTGQFFDRLQRVAFSPDGQRVAGCDKNGSVRIWQLRDAAVGRGAEVSPPERAWQAHRGRAYGLAFDPRQPRLATGGHENHMAIWPLNVGGVALQTGESGQRTEAAHSLAFSPDARRLLVAAADGVQCWDAALGQRIRSLSLAGEPCDHVALACDGRYLAAGRDADRVVRVWQQDAHGYQRCWETADQACDQLVFSPDASWLAIANWTDDEVAVYESASGKLERSIPARQCRSVAFSPDARLLAFTEEDDIVIWDWTARQPAHRLRGHWSTVTYVTFRSDGSLLASCGRDRRINLWDVASGQLRCSMMGHRAFIRQVAFLGSDRLVSLGEDGTVLIWHAGFGMQLCSLHEDAGNPCFHMAVSPCHRWLALHLADGSIPLFDLARPPADAADRQPWAEPPALR